MAVRPHGGASPTRPVAHAAPRNTTANMIVDGETSDDAHYGLFLAASPGLPLGETRFVELADTVQVGRAADVTIADPALSRVHFAVARLAGFRHRLRDLASRNGTYVGGLRVTEQLLQPGDVVRAGSSVFVYAERPLPGTSLLPGFIGASAFLHAVCERIRRVAPLPAAVLIEGETGTGKELVAQALHARSGRRGELVTVNVAALPEPLFEGELFGAVRGAYTGATVDKRGLFASADLGTLFLDEVGELQPAMQAKLLRAAEDHAVRPLGGARSVPVDVRIVAATNVNLGAGLKAGGFRSDLYARLAEVCFLLPPLRERPEDILPLARHFLGQMRLEQTRLGLQSLGLQSPGLQSLESPSLEMLRLEPRPPAPLPELTADFAEALLLYDWPMNARELRSLLRGLETGPAAAVAGAWTLQLLPASMQDLVRVRAPTEDGAVVPAGERPPEPSLDQLRALLERHQGRVKDVAEELGRDRTQIYRWMQRYGLRPASFRERS